MNVVYIFTSVATILGNIAWGYSTTEKGKPSDPAMWFLIQTTVMQVLSVVIVICSVHPHFGYGSWALVAISLLLSVAAPSIFTVLPMQWSATCSFIGNAFCNLVILQGLFTGIDDKVKIT